MKKRYDAPKAFDIRGEELTDDQLEDVAGGMEDSCSDGGCCGGGSDPGEPGTSCFPGSVDQME